MTVMEGWNLFMFVDTIGKMEPMFEVIIKQGRVANGELQL